MDLEMNHVPCGGSKKARCDTMHSDFLFLFFSLRALENS